MINPENNNRTRFDANVARSKNLMAIFIEPLDVKSISVKTKIRFSHGTDTLFNVKLPTTELKFN